MLTKKQLRSIVETFPKIGMNEPDRPVKDSWWPKKTNTEYWLETFPTTEVGMNEPGRFVKEGEVLVTNGFNGCMALIVRVEMPNGEVMGFLAHKHTDPRKIGEFVTDLEKGGLPPDAKLYGTVLYPGDNYGQSLSEEVERLQQQLQQRLEEGFGEQWQRLRSVRYATYEGIPLSVNSNRLVYNVEAGVWLYREGARYEPELSGLLKWDS